MLWHVHHHFVLHIWYILGVTKKHNNVIVMLVTLWTLSSMMSKKKMAATVGGLCMEGLRRGWHFAMIDIKKLQIIFGCAIYTIIQW